MSHVEKEENRGNGFMRLLGEHNKGSVVGELSAHLEDIVLAVRDTGKAGELTLSVKLSPLNETGGDQLSISMDVKPKVPQHARKKSIFFSGDHGELSRVPLNQRDWVSEAEEKTPVAVKSEPTATTVAAG